MKKVIALIAAVGVGATLALGAASALGAGSDRQGGEGGTITPPAGRGPATADAQVQFANVRADGTLHSSFPTNGISSSRLNSGRYQVIFPRKVRKCAYAVTLGDKGADSAGTLGLVTATPRTNQPRGVFVRTADAGGTETDTAFNLTIACKPR